jgi:hypothetical protein
MTDISQNEFIELKKRIDELAEKFDDMNDDITEIKVMLSRQEGYELPVKVRDIENRMRSVERWQLIFTGGLVVSQFLLMLFGKYLFDKLP